MPVVRGDVEVEFCSGKGYCRMISAADVVPVDLFTLVHKLTKRCSYVHADTNVQIFVFSGHPL